MTANVLAFVFYRSVCQAINQACFLYRSTSRPLQRLMTMFTNAYTKFQFTGLEKQLDKMHNSPTHPFCKQPWLHLWWTPYLFRPSLSPLHIVTTSCLTSSIYPFLPRYYNSLYHWHFHSSLQTRLLQFSLYYNLAKFQITRLQHIQNFLARAVVKASKSCHVTLILRSLHWLKITLSTAQIHKWIFTSICLYFSTAKHHHTLAGTHFPSRWLLWSPYGIGQAIIFLPCSSYLSSFIFFLA